MCISQGYTGGDEGVRTSENAFFAALLVPFTFHAVVLDCRAAFRTPSELLVKFMTLCFSLRVLLRL